MKGNVFNAGQAYVAFSRVKSVEGLFIKNFNPASINVSMPVITEMERLSNHYLPSEPLPQVVTLPTHEWIKIGHLNVHSYMAKQEDILKDRPMNQADIMCFTETFLKPHQHITDVLLPSKEQSEVFRLDHVATSTEDLGNGGIMIACSTLLLPESLAIPHSTILEVKSIVITTQFNFKICVVVVYHRPQLPLGTFLPLFDNCLSKIPYQTIPTIVLGDFNDDLLPTPSSSKLLRLMSSRGFSQLVTMPTTDSGSLLDHIYCNATGTLLLT